jgi:hypothetical protein
MVRSELAVMKTAVNIIMMPGKLVRFGNVGCGWQVAISEKCPVTGAPAATSPLTPFLSNNSRVVLIIHCGP